MKKNGSICYACTLKVHQIDYNPFVLTIHVRINQNKNWCVFLNAIFIISVRFVWCEIRWNCLVKTIPRNGQNIGFGWDKKKYRQEWLGKKNLSSGQRSEKARWVGIDWELLFSPKFVQRYIFASLLSQNMLFPPFWKYFFQKPPKL